MLRRITISLLVLFSGLHGKAQSLAGITHLPDTSYSLHSVYRQASKQYPSIQLVTLPPAAQEQMNVPYCTESGKTLHMDVFGPKRENYNGIAVLIIHGGGWRSGNKTMHHALARKLASMGYTCFTPEYRLSTEALYPAAVLDVKSAIRFVRSEAMTFKIDPDKIVIAGHSAGGELAAFAGSTANDALFKSASCLPTVGDEVQAVIDIDGTLSFIHPESGEGDDSKKTSAATYWFGFSKSENPELWKQASPLTHAGPHAAPILFINSSVARMHAGRDDFIKIISTHNIPHSVKSFDDVPHTFCFFEPWFTPMVNATHEFLTSIFKL